jgi:thiol-disulfide isomerase/thioredoxin
MTIAAAHLGALHGAGANGPTRELAVFGRASEWLNSARLTPDDLAGKVVLVDFWTYTCINWLRTLPYVRAWAQKYRQGLVVIGVHTPEFPFEHNVDNVRRAAQQMRIEFPIVIDNDYSIWTAFENHYWPALYLLDVRGRIRHHQFGEGEYPKSERAIQQLLKDAGVSPVNDEVVSVDGRGFETAADWSNLKSPETYIGYERGQNLASPDGARRDQPRTYRAASRLALNEWSLTGEWTIGRQASVLNKAPGQIVYRFHARDAHVVMGPARAGESVRFRVSIDGQAPGAARGLDVNESGDGMAREQRLYQLVRQPTPIVDRTLTIDFLDPQVEAFSFTFG